MRSDLLLDDWRMEQLLMSSAKHITVWATEPHMAFLPEESTAFKIETDYSNRKLELDPGVQEPPYTGMARRASPKIESWVT